MLKKGFTFGSCFYNSRMEEIMNNVKSLAIAHIPCQTFHEVYDFSKALQVGTVFEELNMPFFAADELESTIPANKEIGKEEKEELEREKLLQEINEISFAVNDLGLYLDTHSEESEPRYLYHKCVKKRAELLEEFAAKYYTLTQDCIAKSSCEKKDLEKGTTVFSWSVGPLPWEGACV